MAEFVAAHRTAHGYDHRFDRTLALILDPAHRALAWSASALSYFGSGDWKLAFDYALSHSDARWELRPREVG